MARKLVKKTSRGHIFRDASGLWHYSHERAGHVTEAIVDALANRPTTRPMWFWFNSTPAPIEPNDTVETLLVRWHKWRTVYLQNPTNLLSYLEDYSGIRQ